MMNSAVSTRTLFRRFTLLGIMIIVALSMPLAAASSAATQQVPLINYPDFSSVAGLTLLGTAEQVGNVLRLTNSLVEDPASSPYDQTGSAFAGTLIDTGHSFSTSFQFRQHSGENLPHGDLPADGVAFVIQQNPPSSGHPTYLGFAPSLAVEFDIYRNDWDPNDNHVGVVQNGDPTEHLDIASPGHRLYGTLVTAWIDYDATAKILRIFTATTNAKPASPLLSVPVDLTTISPSAYVALTGETGYFAATQDVFHWFLSVGNPNSQPTVGPITAPVEPIQVNTTINGSASFTDPDTTDTHSAEWEWGDGTSSVGAVAEANGAGSASGSHVYAVPGVYTVKLTVADNNGASGESVFKYIVVYDPTSGFATGGGWFIPGSNTSDPGDLLPALDGTSKANFGFVVKYKNGSSTVPGGNLEFHYNVGKFHARSTSMQWLVVTNNNWAKFQGTVTIAGLDGVFPFRVDARDGAANGGTLNDRFIIKIYKPGADPNTADPIYKASGDLVGGQIKLHRQ